MAKKYYSLAKILAIIAAILYLYSGVMAIIGGHIGLGLILDFVIGIVVLIATGVIKSKKKISMDAILFLILAIVGFILGADLGGNIVLLIAAILMLI